MTSAEHYDSSREPHEFKGFFLPEAWMALLRRRRLQARAVRVE
jgi:hypothetical protein